MITFMHGADSKPQQYYVNDPTFISVAQSHLTPQDISTVHLLSEPLAEALAEWLAPSAVEEVDLRDNTKGSLLPADSPLAIIDDGEMSEEEWSDERIQLWDGGERERNEEWVGLSSNRVGTKSYMDVSKLEVSEQSAIQLTLAHCIRFRPGKNVRLMANQTVESPLTLEAEVYHR